jgi:hypothetical protein
MRAVRFFCVVSPATDGWSWSDLGYRYLMGLRKRKLPVRAVSIGAAFFNPSATDVVWRHWARASDLFTTPIAADYVNIVCCPPNLPLGRAIQRGAFAKAPAERERDGDAVIVREGIGALQSLVARDAARLAQPDACAYVPATALERLWTAGRVNVAITGARPGTPTESERAALANYELVVAPTDPDACRLRAIGVQASVYSPARLARYVEEQLVRDATQAGA